MKKHRLEIYEDALNLLLNDQANKVYSSGLCGIINHIVRKGEPDIHVLDLKYRFPELFKQRPKHLAADFYGFWWEMDVCGLGSRIEALKNAIKLINDKQNNS